LMMAELMIALSGWLAPSKVSLECVLLEENILA
jgi:hypothetical protein